MASAYVFCDELGRPYHPDHFSDRFDRLIATLELRRIRLHDTRHTAASLMLAAGVPVKVVSELMGHSSPTVTLSIYAHVLPRMAEEVLPNSAVESGEFQMIVTRGRGSSIHQLARVRRARLR